MAPGDDRQRASSASRLRAPARGSLIALLDADDLWDPDHCESVVGLLEEHPEAVVAFAPTRPIGLSEGENASPIPSPAPVDLLLPMLRGNFINQSSAIARREDLVAIGGFRAELNHAEDFDLWLWLARRGPFVRAAEINCSYRAHPSQATRDTAPIRRYAWDARLTAYADLQRSLPADRLPAVVHRRWRARIALWPAWKSFMRAYRHLPPSVRHAIHPWRPPWRPVE